MNISTLQDAVEQDNTGVEVPLLDPLGEPYVAADGTPVTITVVGTQSKAVKKAQDAQTRRWLKQATKQTDVDDVRSNRLNLATAGIVGWHGIEDGEGATAKPLDCTPANVRALLEADERVLKQVEDGIARHAAFLASARPS